MDTQPTRLGPTSHAFNHLTGHGTQAISAKLLRILLTHYIFITSSLESQEKSKYIDNIINLRGMLFSPYFQKRDNDINQAEKIIDDLFNRVSANPGLELSVDLEAQTVNCEGESISSFEIDAFRKHCMINGLDDIALTLQHSDEIKKYEENRKQTAPWLF